MSSYLKKNWFMMAVSIILLGIIASFVYKLWFSEPEYDHLKAMNKAPDYQLTDVEGKTVNSQDMQGKVRLVYFFFSNCPDVCQPTSFILSKVQNSLKEKGYLGSKAEIHSITIDPTKDTPEALKKFGGNFQVDPSGWRFLRGDEKKTAELAEKFGIAVIKDKEGNFSHTNLILIVDKKGVIRTFYDPSNPELDSESIVKDVIKLSKEK
jgi:protein SCO1/2